jgi:formate dehydrogenase maturation protein FdhE
MSIKRFKCTHCESDMPIPVIKIAEALNEGKAVMECESCHKLNSIRSDDGESILIG